MRILWFSNTPCAAFSGKIKGTGGWMEALDNAMQNNVELHVAFHYPYKKGAFKNGATTYHPIYTGSILLQSIKNRIRHRVYDSQFLSSYLQLIKDVKPDLIHIHGTENSFLCVLGNTSIPVVISIQGNLTVYYNKYLSGFHGKHLRYKKPCRSLRDLVFGRLCFRNSYRTMGQMAIIEQNHLRKATHIIGRTDWDKRITDVLAPGNTYYISNEILRPSFYTHQWSKPLSDQLVIHTTNSDNYYKGFETLCHALTLLANNGVEVEWRVAGIAENSLINRITKKYLGKNYPTKGLRLMGALPEESLIDSLLSSHIYVMPSHIENSPNNLCEAMILGLPCIATFAGGTSSLLTDKKEGILIQDGDPWSMAGAILELKHNWSQAVEYGQAARRRALLRHDKDTIVKQLTETYRSIISDTTHKLPEL